MDASRIGVPPPPFLADDLPDDDRNRYCVNPPATEESRPMKVRSTPSIDPPNVRAWGPTDQSCGACLQTPRPPKVPLGPAGRLRPKSGSVPGTNTQRL